MKYFKKLLGDNIYLSPRSMEDVEQITEWVNDFETTDYLGNSGNVVTLDKEKKFLEEGLPDAYFVIVTKNEDKIIGVISLDKVDAISRTATLGVFIGDKDYRNKGYGTEAIRLILEYGFRYMNLNNIDLQLMEFNERALKCYEKCGFKEYGRRRNCKFINGKYYDSIYMDILADEFTGDFIRNKNI